MNFELEIETKARKVHQFVRTDSSKGPGSAQNDQGIGVYSFLAALSSGFAIFAVQFLLFLLLRNGLDRVFKPKNSSNPRNEQTKATTSGFIPTARRLWGASHSEIIHKCGLDAYFFLRYLRTLLLIFAPIAALVIPVLIPLNYIGGRGRRVDSDGHFPTGRDAAQVTGLDTLAWGNIKPSQSHRYWAHLTMAILVTFWVCMVSFYEMRGYIKVRQAYLTSARHQLKPSAATILVNSIPTELRNENVLKGIFSQFPGGVKNVWVNRDFSTLLQKIVRRDAIHVQLEAAETALIRGCVKSQKKQAKRAGHRWKAAYSDKTETDFEMSTFGTENASELRLSRDREKGPRSEVWKKFLSKSNRPTHRLPLFELYWLPGFAPFGARVDTIDWCRKELKRLNSEIEDDQKCSERYPFANSAFIQFHYQIAAHMACQSVIHHLPEHMTPRIIGFCPEEIIWTNIALSHKTEWLRTVATYGLLLVILSLWSIPIAWTGALSQIGQLAQYNGWSDLMQETDLLRRIMPAVAGLLPTVMLATLLYLLPPFLELLAEFKGVKTYSLRDEFVQTFYFAFLFIQIFLVVSISSFFTSSIRELATNVRDVQGASDLMSILARNLPKASNYFFSYMILQSLSTSSATLLQVGSLIEHYVIGPLVDRSVRDKWLRDTRPRTIKWGSVFPVYTNFACIALVYCVIAPLISVFAILTFGLLWLAQRYTILYVYQSKYDTGGVLYPRAINQTFTGLYLMDLCLAGLFFIVKNEGGGAACIFHGTIMVIVFISTILFQIFLNWKFGPLLRYLPASPGGANGDMLSQDGVLNQSLDFFFDAPTNTDEAERTNYIPTAGIEFPTDLNELCIAEREALISIAFQHKALDPQQPTVWIPHDNLGVSEDEIQQTRLAQGIDGQISLSNQGASLNDQGRIVYEANPPDLGKFSRVKL